MYLGLSFYLVRMRDKSLILLDLGFIAMSTSFVTSWKPGLVFEVVHRQCDAIHARLDEGDSNISLRPMQPASSSWRSRGVQEILAGGPRLAADAQRAAGAMHGVVGAARLRWAVTGASVTASIVERIHSESFWTATGYLYAGEKVEEGKAEQLKD